MGPCQNKWAIATVSLGKHPSHTLDRKISAAANFGFQGIELVHADLVNYARQNNIPLLKAAENVKLQCRNLGLEVLSLNPLKNFEGNLDSPLSARLADAQQWIDLAVAAGSKIVQVPSQFLQHSTGETDIIVPELQALADLAAQSGITIAYEAVAFAKFNFTWQHSLCVVNAVDRPNFGLCLDSFHIHSREWGDPYAENGCLPNGDRDLEASMTEFVKVCPRNKVLYVQLSDASRFEPPLEEDSPLFEGLEVRDARLAWSRSARPFPLQEPGYFPVVDIARTWLVDYAWQGWVSLEGFLAEAELEENGPNVMAERARKSVEELCLRAGLNG